MYADSLKPTPDKVHPASQNVCPICASQNLMILAEITEMPVLCNVLFERHQDAIEVMRGDIQLAFCHKCGHIFNAAFEPKKVSYNQVYENSLHYSARFQEYIESIAEDLVQRYDLHRKYIIEIGCGQGEFLSLLCNIGDNRGLGFDPAYRLSHATSNDTEQRIRFVNDYYSDQYAYLRADLICSRHTLEHIYAPATLMQTIRANAAPQQETILVFEVPNVLYTIHDLGIWDIIYEHYSYFSPYSLKYLFDHTGFFNCAVKESYEGQFLIIEATTHKGHHQREVEQAAPLAAFVDAVATFAQQYQMKLQDITYALETMRQAKRKVVVWGAGSKGVTFLNLLRAYGLGDLIDFIIDINPRKQQRFVAGSGQQIMPPDFLSAYNPDVIIIMNPIYDAEIRKTLDNLGVQADIMLV